MTVVRVDPLTNLAISAEEPDWTREACRPLTWQPSRQLLRALREYQEAHQTRAPGWRMRARWAVLRHRFWSLIAGADIPLNSSLGGGLLMPHPNGIVVHPDARVGPNCLLFQQVTIGTGSVPGLPRIGGNVEVGSGAKILGGVQIGDRAIIGANAVVLTDVPAGAFVAGVPAQVKRRDQGDELSAEGAD
ncbi:MAG: serine acetyltransferase [Myxococcales bacterium]